MHAAQLVFACCVVATVVAALGADDDSFEMEKRKSAYMRFGKRSDGADEDGLMMDQMNKRKSAYMRFGKRSMGEDDMAMNKRKSAYMRFGKRSMDTEEEMEPMFKRKSAYMRFGRK